MSHPAVLWIWIEAQASATKAASSGEDSMSNLKYAIVEEDMVTATVDSLEEKKHPKPFVVTLERKRQGDTLTRRVESALDKDFANGNMPA